MDKIMIMNTLKRIIMNIWINIIIINNHHKQNYHH